jgi:hypothetical protein
VLIKEVPVPVPTTPAVVAIVILASEVAKVKIGKPAFAVTTKVEVPLAVTDNSGILLIAALNASQISVALVELSEVTVKGTLTIIPLVTLLQINDNENRAFGLAVAIVTVDTCAVSAT